jgi:dsRNA-specific ribonuclease
MGESETRARQCLLGDTRVSQNGESVYCPYNESNKKLTRDTVERYLASHGVDHAVYDMRTFECAVVHRTYIQRSEEDVREAGAVLAPCPKNVVPLAPQSNERLEFLGDGIIEMVVKQYLYMRYPQENEGFLTEKKINIVKNETLGRISKDEGLAAWYQMSQHAEETGVRNNEKKLGGLVESLVGALFIDVSEKKNNGEAYEACRKFVVSLIEKNIDWPKLMTENDNHKNTLQILIQKEFKTTPTYMEVIAPNKDGSGAAGGENGYTMAAMLVLGENPPKQSVPFSRLKTFAKIHELSNMLGGCRIVLGVGKHAFKKKAEQLASFNALKSIKA